MRLIDNSRGMWCFFLLGQCYDEPRVQTECEVREKRDTISGVGIPIQIARGEAVLWLQRSRWRRPICPCKKE